MRNSVIRYAFTALVFFSLLTFDSCEAQLVSEELTSGDSTLILHSNYGLQDTAIQFFNANTRFKVKQNPFDRNGYTFLGWTDSENSAIVLYKNCSEMQFSSSRDLYALWELKTYSITYKLNGGRRNVENPACFTINEGVALDTARNGKFLFGGWYDNEKFSGNPVSSVKKGCTEDQTFYARWCGKINYHLNGGSLSDKNIFIPYELAEKFATEKTANRASEEKAEIAEKKAEKTADTNTEKEAGKEAATSKAEKDEISPGESGRAVSSEKVEKDTAESSAADEHESSLSSSEKSGGTEEADTISSALTAESADNAAGEAEATDDAAGEKTSEEADSASGETDVVASAEKEIVETAVRYFTLADTIVLPLPEKTDYVFGGWYYDSACTRPAGNEIKNASSAEINLYAKWNEPKSYDLTYVLNGGMNAEDAKSSYINSASAIPLPLPSRYGYDFCGWYSDKDFTSETVSEIAPLTLGDLTFYAKWEKTDFTLTYQKGNAVKGCLPEAQTGVYESDLTVSGNKGNLVLNGGTFIGWYARLSDDVKANLPAESLTAAERFVKEGDSLTLLGDTSLTPVWSLEKYTHPLSKAELKRNKRKPLPPKNSELTAVVIPDQVFALGDEVFADFTLLKNFDFTDIISVGARAFASCSSLTDLDLKTVEEIASSAFEDCLRLKTIVLPENLKEIGKNVFSGCPDGMIFVTSADRLDYYKELLTPEVVGKAADSYSIIILD